MLSASGGRLLIIVVWDGLRPDFIMPDVTPVLWEAVQEGVWCDRSHCVYPSATRVNAAALATGCAPGKTGITGNTLYLPGFDPSTPTRLVDTGNHMHLARLDACDGPAVRAPSLAGAVAAAGGITVVASTGSPGSAWLLNPQPDAITINPALQRPLHIAAEVERRFGPAPAATRPATARGDWLLAALLEYLLPELLLPAVQDGRPAVAYWWNTDPDNTAHSFGLGAPETVQSLRENDRRLGALLERLRALDLAARTTILLTSDHGFSTAGPPRGFERALVGAGLRESPESDDVVTTGQGGGAITLHPRLGARAQERAAAIVRWLQQQPWVGTILARDDGPAASVPGTLPLSLVWNGRTGPRAPDLQFGCGWTHDCNTFGIAGTALAGGGRGASHGSSSPYDLRNSLVLWGQGVRRGRRSAVPAGIIDVAPTAAYLLGLALPEADGRVLVEALDGGPVPEALPVEHVTHEANASWPGGGYRQVLHLSRTGTTTYLDGSETEHAAG